MKKSTIPFILTTLLFALAVSCGEDNSSSLNQDSNSTPSDSLVENSETSYKVVFHSNNSNDIILEQEFLFEEEKALLDNTFTYVGYTFEGWSKTSSGRVEFNDKQVVSQLTDNNASVIHLYAVWTANTYSIKFDSNTGEGSMEDLSMTYDVSSVLSANEFSKDGYTFVGWNDKVDGSGKAYTNNQEVKNLATKDSLTLYAQWQINAYDFTIYYNDGSNDEIISYEYNTLIESTSKTLEVESRVDFDKWLVYPTGEEFTFNSTTMPSSDLAIYATFKGQSTITFVTNGGSNIAPISGYEGDAITRPEITPSKEGYTFIDWYADESLTNLFDFNNAVMNEGNTKIYAKWEANSYVVSFDPNGALGEMASVNKTYDDNQAIPNNTFVKEGYTFVGWKNDDGDDIVDGYAGNITFVNNAETTLFAQWKENTYVLELHANNDTLESVLATYSYETNITLSNLFTKPGYEFIGWSLSSNGSVVYEEDEVVNNLTNVNNETVHLYAMWEKVVRKDVSLLINNSEEIILSGDNGIYTLEKILLNKGTSFSVIHYEIEKVYEYNYTTPVKGYYMIIVDINKKSLSYTLIEEYIEIVEYNEENDSVEGVDVTDLSQLKSIFDSINTSYVLETQTYFNVEAIKIINDIYETNYVQRNVINYVSSQDTEEMFTLFDVNSTYVDTYGPTTVKYSSTYSVDYEGWTRIGENKYKCDRTEVVDHFRQLLTPGLSNEGTYMTYKYVTVEVNNDNTLRIRLYCSTTQSGKVIKEHKDIENKPQWYMLLSECIVSNIVID